MFNSSLSPGKGSSCFYRRGMSALLLGLALLLLLASLVAASSGRLWTPPQAGVAPQPPAPETSALVALRAALTAPGAPLAALWTQEYKTACQEETRQNPDGSWSVRTVCYCDDDCCGDKSRGDIISTGPWRPANAAGGCCSLLASGSAAAATVAAPGTTAAAVSGGLRAPRDTYLARGEFSYEATDLTIPGRGFDYQLARTYKSQLNGDGPLGHNWDHNYNRSLVVYKTEPDGTIASYLYFDGAGRALLFSRARAGVYLSPPRFYMELTVAADGALALGDRAGVRAEFQPIGAGLAAGKIIALADRNGNTMRFLYDQAGRLAAVVDTLGRQIEYLYAATGRLAEVRDFADRRVLFGYDAAGDLAAATVVIKGQDPATQGLTTWYTYSSGHAAADANHNLLTITPPGFTSATLVNAYNTTPGDFAFDRLIRQEYRSSQATACCGATGGTAGELSIAYLPIPRLARAAADAEVLKVTVTDGQGVSSDYFFNDTDFLVRQVFHEATLTAGSSMPVATSFEWNALSEVQAVVAPQGNRTEFVHDTFNLSPLSQGNVLEVRREADPARGGDPLVTGYTYEAQFNQVATQTDPGGGTKTSAYDAEGNRVQQTDALGNATRMTYDAHGVLQTTTDPLAHVQARDDYYLTPPFADFTFAAIGLPDRFVFDAASSWDSETPLAGLRVRWDWNDDGVYDTGYGPAVTATHRFPARGAYVVRLEVIDSDALTSTVAYRVNVPPHTYYLPVLLRSGGTGTTDVGLGLGQILTLPGAAAGPAGAGRVLALSRTAAEPVYTQVVTDTDALGHTTVSVYDAYGNLLSITDGNGHKTTYAYDGFGRLVQVTDALGGVTSYSYDARGSLARKTDANGGIWTYRYEGIYLLSATDPLSQTTSYTYDVSGNRTSVIDPAGGRTTFAYDALSRLISTSDAAGGVTTIVYDLNGNRIRETDANGHVTTYQYDGQDRLIRKTVDAGGLNLTTRYTYDADGNLLTQINPDNTRLCFTYDALGRRRAETRDCGGLDLTTVYNYDAIGNVIRAVDPRGIGTAMTYDPLGQITLIRQDDAGLDLATAYRYDAVGNLIAVTDTRGIVTSFAYDALNRQVQQRADAGPGGLNQTTTYTYDALGNLLTATDPTGQTTTRAVDGLGRVVSVADPLSNTTRYSYDAVGNRVSVADPNGVALTYGYDALGRLTRMVNALGQEVSYEYDAVGNRTRIVEPTGQAVRYEYDGANRLIRELSALGNPRTYAYDAAGRQVQMTDPLSHTWTYRYDGAGRPITETNPLGQSTVNAYDAAGNRIAVTDAIPPGGNLAAGRTTLYAYDALNRLVSETDPLGAATTYELDRAGNKTAMRDANLHVTTFVHDALGRLIRVTNALSNTTRYAYDATGRLVSVTQPNGDQIGYSYDAAGRQTAINYPDGTAVNRTFDPAGRITRVTGPDTDLRITYDVLSRPAVISDSLLSKAVGYTYDAAGRRLSLIGPDGTATQYSYDADGRLIGVTQAGRNFGFGYDAAGRMISQTLPNQAQVLYSFDASDRTTGVVYRRPNGAILESLAYELDAAGNSTKLTLANGSTVAYTYDKAGRLTGETRGGSLAYAQTYAYDPAGNRTRWTRDGVTTNYTYNALDQLIQQTGPQAISYTYDANGNLRTQSGGGRDLAYTYTFEGLLASITGAGVNVANRYDAFDRRVAQTISGVTTHFVYDSLELGATVLAEYDAQGALAAAYTLAPSTDGQLARSADGVVGYYLRDGLGSTQYLLGDDGSLLNSYVYDAFGLLMSGLETMPNPVRFAAQRWDEGSQLYHSRARYYDPALGRFTQPDPLGYVEAANLYAYALNDPVNRIDPLGLASEVCDSISYESKQNLGLLNWANRLRSILFFIPNLPRVEYDGKWSVTGQLCRQCCTSGPHAGQWRKVGDITVEAFARMSVTWPLTPWEIRIRKYTLRIGIDAYAEFKLNVSGSGKIDGCQDKSSVKVCGGGSITGGIKGGLLEWPFEAVKAIAYVFGQITGKCETCINYDFPGELSMAGTQCSVCVEAGYHIEVKWWRFTYTRRGYWVRMGGC